MALEQMPRIEGVYPIQKEQKEAEKRSYTASVLTPRETLDTLKEKLVGASQVKMLFLNALGGEGQPLEELTPFLQQVKGKKEGGEGVVLGVSEHHVLLFPQGEATVFPPYLTRKNSERKKADEAQRARTETTYQVLEEGDVQIKKTKAFGISPRMFGIADHVHSKVIQVVREGKNGEAGEVITILPEFNLDKHTVDDAVNYALQFVETTTQAARPDSISSVFGAYFDKVIAHESFDDYSVRIDGNDDLLFLADVGRPNKSIIRDTTEAMFADDSAADLFFASQFPPLGKVFDSLVNEAKTGIPVGFFLSESCKKGWKANLFERSLKPVQQNTQKIYAEKVHSKVALKNAGIQIREEAGVKSVVIVDTGKQMEGVFGSSNNHPAGYMLGTGEVALRIRDQDLLQQIAKKVVEDMNTAQNPQEKVPDFIDEIAS